MHNWARLILATLPLNCPSLLSALSPEVRSLGEIAPAITFSVGHALGQLRLAPVALGEEDGMLTVFSEEKNVDPFHENFFLPKHTLKLAVFDSQGRELWRVDLGRGIIPGVWFCPVFPFDLDGDGVDEVWHIANPDTKHPFAISKQVLVRRDARTGEALGSWPWPRPTTRSLAHMFRNFIFGGHVNGQPVLVTAQGTYGVMSLQAWNPDMSRRWTHSIAEDAPGARGAHTSVVVDFDSDGVDEVLWGERRIELDKGTQLWCADEKTYVGHSDVIQPFYQIDEKRWYVFTCREKDLEASPRIATYDQEGNRVWGALEFGHIHRGWVARLLAPDRYLAMGLRIDFVDGKKRIARESFTYDARTGEPVELPFEVSDTIPVDMDGDGQHELVYLSGPQSGNVIDGLGELRGQVEGYVAFAGHLLNAPGEHLVTYDHEGTVRVWRDRRAVETTEAQARYSHPFYQANRRQTAVGYSHSTVSGY